MARESRTLRRAGNRVKRRRDWPVLRLIVVCDVGSLQGSWESSSNLSLKALQIERHQLERCRWAFGLFWAGFIVQLLPLFFLVEEPVIPSTSDLMKPVTVEEVVKEQALFLLPCVLLTLTGAVLNIVVARTPRWRQAAWLLLGTVTAELVMAIVGILAMGPSFIPAEGQPLLTRLSFHAASIMLPLSWWWIVVIIGEFATACRETILLGQSRARGLWHPRLILGTDDVHRMDTPFPCDFG